MKDKAFTLIELLAVIIILGILMLIAIPSVTKYINDSRKNTYVSTAKELVRGTTTLVNGGNLDMMDTDTTYYIPYTCVDSEVAKKSPYGDFEDAYVVVTYNKNDSYDYYFYSKDTQGIGVYPITEEAALSADCIRTGLEERLSTNIGIGRRKNIKVYNSDCTLIAEEKLATEKNPKVDGNGNVITNETFFMTGTGVNGVMISLAGNDSTKIKHIKLSDEEPTEENKQSGNVVSASDSKYPIYMWYEESTETIYCWSEDIFISFNKISSYFFSRLEELQDIELLNEINTELVTNMSYMFYNCKKLEYIDLSNFDTSNVTDMRSMFYDCDTITSLDLSSFDTSNVVTLASTPTADGNGMHVSSMFSSCNKLKYINMSGFDLSNVIYLTGLFYNCIGLEEVDMSYAITPNVTNMYEMFGWCSKLKRINLTGIDMSSVTCTKDMFRYNIALTSISFGDIDTSDLVDMSCMFWDCNALESIDLSIFNVSHVTDMYAMFRYCYKLSDINTTGWDTSNVTDMRGMFEECRSIVI